MRSWLPVRNYAKPPKTPRILKFGKDKNGYNKVRLRSDGSHFDRRVATLVAIAWHGERPAGMIVRHIDGSKTNDTPGNLKWGSYKENSNDSKRHGTWTHGTGVNTAKLKEVDVIYVLKSNEGHATLARKLGVSPGAIWHIRAGRSWKHVSI